MRFSGFGLTRAGMPATILFVFGFRFRSDL